MFDGSTAQRKDPRQPGRHHASPIRFGNRIPAPGEPADLTCAQSADDLVPRNQVEKLIDARYTLKSLEG